MSKKKDRELGMDRAIDRRDFLNGMGVAVTAATGLLGSSWLEAVGLPPYQPEAGADYYPPALTGMRGSHAGSFEAAHQLREGAWPDEGRDTGETYDLVVVGGGISGLAAAYFYRRATGPDARILVLDNHDDFGGHAKRNEFSHSDRLLIGYGGTQSIDTPSRYSAEAMRLLEEIGIEVDRFYDYFDRKLYRSLGLSRSVFFDKETFGSDRLVTGEGERPWKDFFGDTPLSERGKADLVRLYEEKKDYLPGLTKEEKIAKLRKTSYQDFLLNMVGLSEDVLPYFKSRTHGFWTLGIEAIPALYLLQFGFPGGDGLGVKEEGPRRPDPYIFHFPDGNASVARLLVRSLVPDAIPGGTMEDVVTTRCDYSRLDRADAKVKVRLNSTAVLVRHRGDDAVEVTYARGGETLRVRGKRVVLACYNSMIPYICPELPQAQKEALAWSVKAPLVYTNVLIRDWTAWKKLGIQHVYLPGGYHSTASLDFPVSLGKYQFGKSPEDPTVLHLVRVPLSPGLPQKEQHRAGRYDLLSTSFETFERHIRDELGRALSGGGFDPARDIEAITVNRWPHGYACWENPLFEPETPADQKPWVLGRKRFGRIAIANSDAGAHAYTDAAIDQAYRAVTELESGMTSSSSETESVVSERRA
jgi:spermidine dehydrogenase